MGKMFLTIPCQLEQSCEQHGGILQRCCELTVASLKHCVWKRAYCRSAICMFYN